MEQLKLLQVYEGIGDQTAAAWRYALRRPWIFVGYLCLFGVAMAPFGVLLGGWYQWAVNLGVVVAADFTFRRTLRRRVGLARRIDDQESKTIVRSISSHLWDNERVFGVHVQLKTPNDAKAFTKHLLRLLIQSNEVLHTEFIGSLEGDERRASEAEFINQFESVREIRIVSASDLLNGDELWGIPRGRYSISLVAKGERSEAMVRAAVDTW